MSIINLITPMSDDKERQRRNSDMIEAIEQYTEERMAIDYVCEPADDSRSGGQPVLKPCPFCGSLPKSGDSTYGYWLIFCSDENNCLAQPSVELKTEAEAIAAWNTRQPTQSDALREALWAMPEPYEYLNKDQLKSIRPYVDALRNWKHRYRAVLQEQSK